MRHAEAESPNTFNDFGRVLTTKGMRQAALVGQMLQDKKIPIDLIAASTATRTQTTAQLVAERLQMPLEKVKAQQQLYNASVRALLAFVNEMDNSIDHLLIIAHNPGISYFADYLTKSDLPSFQPASIAILELETTTWLQLSENTCKLVSYTSTDEVEL
ncbi:MAG: histidine phosphatase family protein [Bacteroidota bacterium]